MGTVTEIYDYLRLLFARVGQPHCPKCGRPVERQTVQQIVDAILSLPEDSRVTLLAPKVRRKKGEHKDVFEAARRAGFVRIRVNSEILMLDETDNLNLNKQKWHYIELVVDRLVIRPDTEHSRVSESVETALREGDGVLQALRQPREEGAKEEELVFSEQFACVRCGTGLSEIEPRTFSFNSPHGACPQCTGLGYKLEVDPNLVIPNKNLSLLDGAVAAWSRAGASSGWYVSMMESVARAHDFSPQVPVKDLDEEHLKVVLYGNKSRKVTVRHRTHNGRVYNWETRFEGVIHNLERRYRETDSDHTRQEIERYMTARPCQACRGQRLKPEALGVKVCGLGIMDVTAMNIAQGVEWVRSIDPDSDMNAELNASGGHTGQVLARREKSIANQILKEIEGRLHFLEGIGLDYVTMNRTARTLSGGEAQRVRLATQIGSGLTGVLYVCDEPTVGLHPHDDHRLINTLTRLRDMGNTVIVVEHDEAMMRAADFIVDLGPGAGEHGGHVVATGVIDEVMANPASLTGQYLSGAKEIPMPESRRAGSGEVITVSGARENNLKNVEVSVPLGVLTCVTGVSGSGKSTLIYDILYKSLAQTLNRARDYPGDHDAVTGVENIDKVVNIDQSPSDAHPAATRPPTPGPLRRYGSCLPLCPRLGCAVTSRGGSPSTSRGDAARLARARATTRLRCNSCPT